MSCIDCECISAAKSKFSYFVTRYLNNKTIFRTYIQRNWFTCHAALLLFVNGKINVKFIENRWNQDCFAPGQNHFSALGENTGQISAFIRSTGNHTPCSTHITLIEKKHVKFLTTICYHYRHPCEISVYIRCHMLLLDINCIELLFFPCVQKPFIYYLFYVSKNTYWILFSQKSKKKNKKKIGL